MDAQPSAALHFPDVPKLELDVLIDQLVDRARDVQQSQGRLRALLRAIYTLTGDPSLEATLLNVVTAACELADARYGALGVVGFDEQLEQFVTVGMDTADIAALDAPPKGLGLLGALIREPHPIRLRDLHGDDRSVGFPPGHPPMESFLGAPIRVHGAVYGHLYLTESASGEFSGEDEELVSALALAAGAAISNARLLQESGLRQRWLTASVEISAQLLADDGNEPLQVIADRAIDLADADQVVVSLLGQDALELVVEAAAGSGSTTAAGRRTGVAADPVWAMIGTGEPVLRAGTDGDPEGHLMALPLGGADGVRGVLEFLRLPGRRPFSDSDLATAATFAAHASVALELADARETRQQLVRAEDRNRIARNLHDHVIQELFAIGLGLETTATMVEPGGVAAERISQRVRDIDRTIRQIRTSIFELRGPLDTSTGGARHQILHIAADLSDALGFTPQVTFSGLVDTSLSPELAEDLFAAVRELLTNVAKHAHATRADVEVSVRGAEVGLVVTDDGVGHSGTGRSSGLTNLRTRAERRGGSFALTPADPGGTTATWKALL